jgi:RimJ/RimL family protein N-acetyltransferase
MSREAGSLGLERVLAITSPENLDSARLLEKLGFQFERLTRLDPGSAEVKVWLARIGSETNG